METGKNPNLPPHFLPAFAPVLFLNNTQTNFPRFKLSFLIQLVFVLAFSLIKPDQMLLCELLKTRSVAVPIESEYNYYFSINVGIFIEDFIIQH